MSDYDAKTRLLSNMFHEISERTKAYSHDQFQKELEKMRYSLEGHLLYVKGSPLFTLNRCYSHFEVQYNKEYNKYSIGITIPNFLYDNICNLEEYLTTVLSKGPMKTSVYTTTKEDKVYHTLYLPLNRAWIASLKDSLDKEKVVVTGAFRLFAIHKEFNFKLLYEVKDIHLDEVKEREYVSADKIEW